MALLTPDPGNLNEFLPALQALGGTLEIVFNALFRNKLLCLRGESVRTA